MSPLGIELAIPHFPTGRLRQLGHRSRYFAFKTLSEKSTRGNTMYEIDNG